MQSPRRPKGKPPDRLPDRLKESRASLALRIDRAAADLNPFLLVVTIGLLLLNVTLYLGLMAAQHPFAWAPPVQQAGPDITAAPLAPAGWQSPPANRR